jgi:hypothetical protein
MNQLIHCINCDEVFFKTPFDQSPEYAADPANVLESFSTLPKDDFKGLWINTAGNGPFPSG